jgi:hypothetical protein
MIDKHWRLLLPFAALLAALAFFAACGDDDDDGGGGSEEDRQEIAELVNTLANANGETATQEEIDFFLAHVTDEFVQGFGTDSVEACGEDPVNCIGEPLPNPTVNEGDVEVDGDTATATINSDFGLFGLELIREDDVWKASGQFVPDDEIAEGTEVIDLALLEFAFEADLSSDAVASGDFAFHVTNEGEQVHEVLLVALPEEGTIAELLEDEGFQPEPIFVKVPYDPGDESDVALPEPLAAGRYGLICFLPDTDDPEMTPHAFKGMTAEFTVE